MRTPLRAPVGEQAQTPEKWESAKKPGLLTIQSSVASRSSARAEASPGLSPASAAFDRMDKGFTPEEMDQYDEPFAMSPKGASSFGARSMSPIQEVATRLDLDSPAAPADSKRTKRTPKERTERRAWADSLSRFGNNPDADGICEEEMVQLLPSGKGSRALGEQTLRKTNGFTGTQKSVGKPATKPATKDFLANSSRKRRCLAWFRYQMVCVWVFMLVVLTPATFYYMHVVKDSSMEMTLAVCYCVVICSTLLLFASLKV